MSLGDRIKQCIEPIGGVPGLEARTGLKRNTIYGWINGPTEPKASDLLKIANAASVTADYLLKGTQSENSNSMPTPTPLIPVPRFNQEAAAGDGAVVLQDHAESAIMVDANWLARYVPPGATVSVLEARGESMEPTIRDGDLMLVSHDITEGDVRSGGIFVVTHYGGLKVKRLEGWPGGIRLSSLAGAEYGEDVIAEDRIGDDLIIHGRVFWSGGRLRRG